MHTVLIEDIQLCINCNNFYLEGIKKKQCIEFSSASTLVQGYEHHQVKPSSLEVVQSGDLLEAGVHHCNHGNRGLIWGHIQRLSKMEKLRLSRNTHVAQGIFALQTAKAKML